jgi:hypothetical protein
MTRLSLSILAVASPYAWDVVESARRAALDVRCIDNYGGADPGLPALVTIDQFDDFPAPFVLGLSSAGHRAAAAQQAFRTGFQHPRRSRRSDRHHRLDE